MSVALPPSLHMPSWCTKGQFTFTLIMNRGLYRLQWDCREICHTILQTGGSVRCVVIKYWALGIWLRLCCITSSLFWDYTNIKFFLLQPFYWYTFSYPFKFEFKSLYLWNVLCSWQTSMFCFSPPLPSLRPSNHGNSRIALSSSHHPSNTTVFVVHGEMQ